MSSITRKNWVAEQAGRSVDLEKLRQDPAALARLEQAGVSLDRLARADRDGDGKVDAAEAWQVADAFDHDGNAQTVLGLDVTGNDTVSARVLAGFGGVFDVAPTRPTVVPRGAERFWDGQHLAFSPAFLAEVRASHGAPAVARFEAWATLINSSQGATEREKVDLVNEFFNAQVVYTPEPSRSGSADYWQSPLESLTLGTGDCEDYAMAKFLSLRMLGLPADRLEVAFVRHATAGMHAVALLRDDAGTPWVLDNMQFDALRSAGRPELSPLLSVNELRTQALDPAHWDLVGPRGPAGQVVRFKAAMERSAPVLTDAALATFGR